MTIDVPAGPPHASADAHPPWHTLAASDAARALGSSDAGLASDDARRRLDRFGPNALEPPGEERWWVTARRQFQDPMIYVLLAAAGVTAIQRDVADMVVILAVVLVNAAIGFAQERKARQMVRALTRLATPRAQVLRDGRTVEIDARDLVPGDVALLTSGSRVPADLRLAEVHDFTVDESLLTGESVPVDKSTEALPEVALVVSDQRNMAFAGTVAARGRARGVVVRTGSATELGSIAHAITEAGTTATPLQEAFARFGRRIGAIVLGLAALLVVIGFVRQLPAAEVLLTAVAMAVSAVPEGLPVVFTITLAIGVRRMAARRAIIRSLPAVETLGSTTVIGSDKTGTLTQNVMTVRAIWADGAIRDMDEVARDRRPGSASTAAATGEDEPLLLTLRAGVLASEADPAGVARGERVGDPTEIALLVAAARAGIATERLASAHPEADLLPFESERRFMVSLREHEGAFREYVKGAPEAVLLRCASVLTRAGIAPIDRAAAAAASAALAARGLRVLAMAYRDTPSARLADESTQLVLCGLAGMEDPVRAEVPAAMDAARGAGIRVLVLTGDHIETARAVGTRLGLGDRAVVGQDLVALSDEELDAVLRDVSIYARVAPEHKLRIVHRLKAQGEVVAVTGDGVNDAPALRAAHLGIAMGATGSDVARDAADMVLADDNFATITAAIEEGRGAFANIRRATFFLLSSAAGEVFAILVSVLVGWPVPFTPIQILWINLVTDSFQAVALAFERPEPGVLEQRPRPRGAGVLEGRHFVRLALVGALLAGATLAMFAVVLDASGDLGRARSMALTLMVVLQFFHLFSCRSLDRSAFTIPLRSNRFLVVSMLATAAIHAAALYVPGMRRVLHTMPPNMAELGLMLAGGALVIAAGELDKWQNRRAGMRLG